MKPTFLLLLIIQQVLCKQQALTVVSSTTADNKNEGPMQDQEPSSDEPVAGRFQAEKDWKEVKPGEVLPPGLHVRIDLTTGRREAKLLDDKPEGPQKSDEDVGRVHLASDNFKNFVKGLRDDGPDQPRKHRSLDEIKQELSSLKLKSRSESQLLEALLVQYQNATPEGKVPLLQDMEFILHQYDAARDFVKMGGLGTLAPDLNATVDEVRALVASTLGSAVQGNPDVQSQVLEADLLPALLRLVALDVSHRVRTTAFFALSCLVRNFPRAQDKFLAQGGLSVLAALMGPAAGDFRGDYIGLKLALKALTLLHDLVEEERVTQDSSLEELLASIRLHGICARITPLLEGPEIDTQEKVVRAMLALAEACTDHFRQAVPLLQKLRKEYQQKASEESTPGSAGDGAYFEGLLVSINQLLQTLETPPKEEL